MLCFFCSSIHLSIVEVKGVVVVVVLADRVHVEGGVVKVPTGNFVQLFKRRTILHNVS